MNNPEPFEGLAQALHYVEDLSDTARAGEQILIDGEPRLLRWVYPSDHKEVILDLDKYQLKPHRKTGTATMRDLESFTDYISLHKNQSLSGTAVYRDGKGFTAILNGHGVTAPGWGDHRAVFEPKWTPGWTGWTAFNNQWLTQDDFAEFLVERIPEIASPAAATIIEAVQNLRIHWEAKYERVIQPNNDFVQLRYTEDEKAGEFKVPAAFTIVVTPFEGAAAVTLEARLRFAKPNEKNQIKFQYKLGEAVEKAVDNEFLRMQAEIAETCGVPVYWGSFQRGS